MTDDARHTFEVLARHLIGAARPLIEAGSSFGAFKRLMARLGFDATSLPPAYTVLATTVSNAVDKITSFPASPTLPDILALLDDAKAVFEAVQNLAASPPPAGVDPGAYATEIGERLFELLLTDYLASECAATFNVLAMLHVVDQETVPRTASRPGYLRTRFHWDELPKVISSPGDLPARVYGWGTPDFNVARALEHLTGLFAGLDFPVRMRATSDAIARGYLGLPDTMLDSMPKSLELPFFHDHFAEQDVEAAIVLRRAAVAGARRCRAWCSSRVSSAAFRRKSNSTPR